MEAKIDWLDKHSNASKTLMNIVYEIEGLAKGFRTTGNGIICTQLKLIASDIEKARKDMSDAVGESIKETIDRSGEHSKTLLEATLAGILMASQPKEEDHEQRNTKISQSTVKSGGERSSQQDH